MILLISFIIIDMEIEITKTELINSKDKHESVSSKKPEAMSNQSPIIWLIHSSLVQKFMKDNPQSLIIRNQRYHGITISVSISVPVKRTLKELDSIIILWIGELFSHDFVKKSLGAKTAGVLLAVWWRNLTVSQTFFWLPIHFHGVHETRRWR